MQVRLPKLSDGINKAHRLQDQPQRREYDSLLYESLDGRLVSPGLAVGGLEDGIAVDWAGLNGLRMDVPRTGMVNLCSRSSC